MSTQIATINISRLPFDWGYAFEVEYAGVPLEDHALGQTPLDTSSLEGGLARIGKALDEIEQAGP